MVFEGLRLVEWSTNANEWSDMFSNFVQLGFFILTVTLISNMLHHNFAVQIDLKDIIANC